MRGSAALQVKLVQPQCNDPPALEHCCLTVCGLPCMQEFATLWRSLYTVFAAAVGEFESNTYIDHHNPRLTVPLLVIYLFVVTIIMLNVLIALLTNAQQKVRLPLRKPQLCLDTLAWHELLGCESTIRHARIL